ncbi:MOSC N-terminal beta barrel domain-containing protein [Pectobacterium cacticida]|uniref:MOSC N-terminal beta barrel domain-containing protein n=1 Tax=Pectobacterium cacticida TaxID=69221 RepID=A0ABZ2G6H2_9GAMM|nr:MOSC N-terminal beta barrel domain-containing protein [Pectobacterium cacticida]UYX08245.1 MOSC N-terminal beta barrel domain-containing protein [Pectobacterium cacticida]
MVAVTRLYIHPVKSMRGLQLSHAMASVGGLAHDRAFMVTEPDGTFITARQYPQMVLFTPALLPDGLFLAAPDGQSATIRFTDFVEPPQPTEVWGTHFTAHVAPDAINTWLSQYFHRAVQLRWVGHTPSRRVKHYPAVPLAFADGYPFLLINDASFQALRQRCSAGIKIEQFRANVVVAGAEAFAEDSWKVIRIGEIVFDVVKPCSRCVFTTVSIEGGRKHPTGEPLATLQSFRTADNGDVDFGLNLVARNTGIIRVGDTLEVLETQPPRRYGAGQEVERLNIPVSTAQAVTIHYQGKSLPGNNQHILLEQLEQQGIRIPYSCRAGLCGCCKLTLVSGEVAALKQNAIRANGEILSCSCIPQSDVHLQ